MPRTIRSLLAVGVALTALESAAVAQATTRLVGTIGPEYIITLKAANGRTVTKIRAGTYLVVIRDRSSTRNFHLVGPGGINERTGRVFVGTTTWKLRLRSGLYSYTSDHTPFMPTKTFRVL